MPEKESPGVIFKSKFVLSKQKFTEYINYINRPEAVRNRAYGLYSVYMDGYMDDPRKQPGCPKNTSALFTATKDRLTKEEKEILKRQFQLAQQAGSPMWQQVISFSNQFLEKAGIYDSSSGRLDEGTIRTVTRLAVKEMLKAEHMEGAAVWSAAIHYNTDNIHVHIAVVEPNPTRKMKEFVVKTADKGTVTERQYAAAMKNSTLQKVKSKIVNSIVNRSPELTKINSIIRENIVAQKRATKVSRDRNLQGEFLNLYRKLPADRRLWFYNMNALAAIRPEIDAFTKRYLRLYHRQDIAELSDLLQRQEQFFKSAYGDGTTHRYKQYAQTKWKDLYTRMGNAVLRELREYDKTVRKELALPRKKLPVKQKLRAKKKLLHVRCGSIYQLKKALKKEVSEMKNRLEFERLQQNIDWEQERQGLECERN
ncbi:MAG: Relaxase [Oscillospiraceae bacterium]|jgi:predicted transcriptional regulator